MRNVVLLVLVALLWGCQEKVAGPKENVSGETPVVYGKSAVRIPGVAALGKKAVGERYQFELTVSGDDMKDISIVCKMGAKDTMLLIDNIPVGDYRLFKGIIRRGKNIIHEGSAWAPVYAGRVTDVQLYLKANGSARIEVIIDNGQDAGYLSGCMSAEGRLYETELRGMSIEFLESKGNQFWTYIKRNGEFVGKFWGVLNGDSFFGEFFLEEHEIGVRLEGVFNDDMTSFKSTAFDMNDTTREVGVVYGRTIACSADTVSGPDLSGCYKVLGEIRAKSIDGLQIKDLVIYDGGFETYLYDGATVVAKFDARLTDLYVDGRISLIDEGYMVLVKGSFDSEGIRFKGTLYDMTDTTIQVGVVSFLKIECTPVIRPVDLSGCYRVFGEAGDISLEGMEMREAEMFDGMLQTYLYKGNDIVAKFFGDISGQELDGGLYLIKEDFHARVMGSFSADGSSFKGMVFENTVQEEIAIGNIGMVRGDCQSVEPVLSECYEVDGVIRDDTLFSEVVMRGMKFTEDSFKAQLFRSGVEVGIFEGYFDRFPFEFTGFFTMNKTTSMVKGGFSGDGAEFKGEVFSNEDTTERIGYVYGNSVDCDVTNDSISEPVTGFIGCYEMSGEFSKKDSDDMITVRKFDDVIMQVKTFENNRIGASFAKDGVWAGSLFGTVSGNYVDGFVYVKKETGEDTVMVKGSLYESDPGMKMTLYSLSDTTKVVGAFSAQKTECSVE